MNCNSERHKVAAVRLIRCVGAKIYHSYTVIVGNRAELGRYLFAYRAVFVITLRGGIGAESNVYHSALFVKLQMSLVGIDRYCKFVVDLHFGVILIVVVVSCVSVYVVVVVVCRSLVVKCALQICYVRNAVGVTWGSVVVGVSYVRLAVQLRL